MFNTGSNANACGHQASTTDATTTDSHEAFRFCISLASGQAQSGFHAGWFVCDGGRQLQLDLRAGAAVAPHVQSCTDSIGAFTNAAYSPVSGALRVVQALRVDARPIIANAQAEHLIVVANLRLDSTSGCV